MTIAELKDAIAGRPHTLWERRADGAVHALGFVAGLVGSVILIVLAALRGGLPDAAVIGVYAAGLVAMFACSAAYNLGRWSRHRNWLRCLDQVAIFAMIAGNYTPFTVLSLQGSWSVALTVLIWTIAGGGILVRLVSGRIFDRLSVGLYLALGWIGVVAFFPLAEALGPATLTLLVAGGLAYTAGLAFHYWERLPFQNAIWHAFVLAGAALHFAAVASSLGPASAS